MIKNLGAPQLRHIFVININKIQCIKATTSHHKVKSFKCAFCYNCPLDYEITSSRTKSASSSFYFTSILNNKTKPLRCPRCDCGENVDSFFFFQLHTLNRRPFLMIYRHRRTSSAIICVHVCGNYFFPSCKLRFSPIYVIIFSIIAFSLENQVAADIVIVCFV